LVGVDVVDFGENELFGSLIWNADMFEGRNESVPKLEDVMG
jgi:hypothetical protein